MKRCKNWKLCDPLNPRGNILFSKYKMDEWISNAVTAEGIWWLMIEILILIFTQLIHQLVKRGTLKFKKKKYSINSWEKGIFIHSTPKFNCKLYRAAFCYLLLEHLSMKKVSKSHYQLHATPQTGRAIGKNEDNIKLTG